MLNIIKKIKSFWAWSLPFITVFNPVYGTYIALQIRKAIWAGQAGSLIEVKIPHWKHPIVLRAGSSDGAVFHQVFLEKQGYFPTSTPKYIVDAGANIGLVSACLANRWPQSEILAVEVEKNNYDMLVKNCHPYPNISTIYKGIWSHTTELVLENPKDNSWSFRVVEAPAGTPNSISAIGIKELMLEKNWPQIDILKMDIEGGEFDIFDHDISEWIDHVNCLVIEIHESIRPGVTKLVTSTLKDNGFTYTRWSEYWIFSRTNNIQSN